MTFGLLATAVDGYDMGGADNEMEKREEHNSCMGGYGTGEGNGTSILDCLIGTREYKYVGGGVKRVNQSVLEESNLFFPLTFFKNSKFTRKTGNNVKTRNMIRTLNSKDLTLEKRQI